VQHTEDKDLVAEAVIAPDETVPDLRDGGPDHVIAAHGLEIEGHVTGGPDLGQEDVHVPPEEDQGTGELKLFNRCEAVQFEQLILVFLLLPFNQSL